MAPGVRSEGRAVTAEELAAVKWWRGGLVPCGGPSGPMHGSHGPWA